MDRRTPTLSAATTALALLLGCTAGPDPAKCDTEAALELVHSRQGLPAFAGQALVITSCGAGGFCHSEGIAPEDRFGTPAGLDFDLRLASTSGQLEPDAVARLGRHQEAILAHAQLAWHSVDSGRMPPGGEVGEEYAANVPTAFERVDGSESRPLPSLRTEEGRAILLNWLSCGAPVVERTTARLDGLPNEVGFTAPTCGRECVEPSWGAIYDQVIGMSCALGRCHSSASAAGELVLDGGPGSTLDALLAGEAGGSLCAAGAQPLLVPGDPEESLLWLKLEGGAELCGAPMPPSGEGPSAQTSCAIREWIACGACADASDPECADCLGTARETCAFDAALPGGCVEALACASQLPD